MIKELVKAITDPQHQPKKAERAELLQRRTEQQASTLDALDRERAYAEREILLARRRAEALDAEAVALERNKKVAQAVAVRLKQAEFETRVDLKTATLNRIATERARWAKRKPDRDGDWP